MYNFLFVSTNKGTICQKYEIEAVRHTIQQKSLEMLWPDWRKNSHLLCELTFPSIIIIMFRLFLMSLTETH